MKPKVLIAVPTQEFARRADFYDYYNALEKPEGTLATFSHGQSPAKNRNIMIRTALEQNATHILFIDDDMAVPSDGLIKLLAHDKDIVSGLYLLRNYPHFPLMFKRWFPDGRCQYDFLTPDKKGLVPVVNIGLGFCLIKIDVFKKLKDPWITLGAYEKDGWCDDINFFNKCREAGYEMFVDTDVACGHIMSAIIIPVKTPEGNWVTQYNTGSVEAFHVPQVVPTPEQIEEGLKVGGVK
jgi:hypothetical protein